MPFDFDGCRLLWLQYMDNDVRELYLYNTDLMSGKEPEDQSRLEKINRFVKADGMISHARLMKMTDLTNRNELYIYWVKNGS